jgi:ComF family protein
MQPFKDGTSDPVTTCSHCPTHELVFSQSRSAVGYTGTGRELVLALKHGDKTNLAQSMGRWMAVAGFDLRDQADPLVIPVPLHWTRRLKRRGDQAAVLAQVIARHWETPLGIGILKRRHATPMQAGLNADQRWRNVENAFSMSRGAKKQVKNAAIILIDDVMTTGATLNACARTLIDNGARRVDTLTFARSMAHPIDVDMTRMPPFRSVS